MIEDNLIDLAPSQNPQDPEITMQDPRATVAGGSLLRPQDPPMRLIPQGPVKSDYDLMLERVDLREKAADKALLRTFQQVSKVNPELAGEAQRMGIELGISPELAEGQIDKVRQLWEQRQIEALRTSGGSEQTVRALLDPSFAKIARDDTENLSWTEMLWAQRKAAKLEEERSLLWDKQLRGVATAPDLARIDEINQQVFDLPSSSAPGTDAVHWAMRTWSGMETSLLTSMGAAAAGGAAAVGVGTLGPQAFIPEELASVPAMSGAAFFGTMAGMSAQREAGNAYGTMIGMGIRHDIAARYATGVGVVNGLLETVSAGILSAPFRREITRSLTKELAQDFLVKPTMTKAASKFALTYAKGVGGEVVTEVTQELSNVIGEQIAAWRQAGIDPSKLKPEEQQPFLERMVGIIGETVRGMILLGLPGPAFNLAADMRRARAADADQKWIQNLGKAGDESKVRPRNKRAYAKFLEQLAEGSDAESVYFTVEEFEDVMKSAGLTTEQLAEFAPQIARSLIEQRDSGVIEVPTSEYGAEFLSTDFGKALLPHASLQPGGVTAADRLMTSPEEQQRMAEEAEQLLTERSESAEKLREEAAEMEASIVQRLVSAGRTPAEAAVQARYYRNHAVLSAREEGLSPLEWQKQFGIDFYTEEQFAALQEGGDIDSLDQGRTDSPEFKAWFGESKVVDEAGKPLVVYHGTRVGFEEFRADRPQFFTSDPGVASAYAMRYGGDRTAEAKALDAEYDKLRQKHGMWEAPKTAEWKALDDKARTHGSRVVPAFLSMRNPLILKRGDKRFGEAVLGLKDDTGFYEEIAAEGYDGLILQGVRDKPLSYTAEDEALASVASDVYVPIAGTQIKSATGNRGTFDPSSPNILEQLGESRIKDPTPAMRRLLKNLTLDEQRKVTDLIAKKVIDQLKKLPSAEEMAAVANGGEAKRGWYRNSANAIEAIFGGDGPRFAMLLAAMSPQTSVEANLENALNTWKNWVAAGRPQTREEIVAVMGKSVQGRGGVDSVLDAWKNNSVRALTAADPKAAVLSGPKVNSFFRNLIGHVEEVTNDAWMANYALVDQAIFGGSLNKAETDPGKSVGYMAMSARTREAAAFLAKTTGVPWTPAEVQETVWSWAKTLYELQSAELDAPTALLSGKLTDELINSTPDFSTLFHDPVYSEILIEAGYGEQLRTLQAAGRDPAGEPQSEPGAAGEAAAPSPEARRDLQLRAAKRLAKLRVQRERDKLAAAKAKEQAEGLDAPTRLGRYLPELRTMLLSPDANPSTVMHEMSHFFFSEMVDRVARGKGSPRTVADLDTLLQWFGIKGQDQAERFANWQAMPFDAQVKYHEQLSYNFELYLYAGKAPTAPLARIFAKIRTWMLSAYEDIRGELNAIYRATFGVDLPGLTPEVRMVFDRLVASEKAVELGEASRSMAPLFMTREEFLAAGYTDEQWDGYQQALADAHEQSNTDLGSASLRQMRWLTNARSRVLKQLQKEAAVQRGKVEKQVRTEVQNELVYLLQDILRTSKASGKLSLEEVRARLSNLDEGARAAVETKLGTGRRGVLAKDGLPIEVVAANAGYTSGDEMVAALVAARPIDEEVDLRTTKRMLDQHSEFTDPKRIEEQVEKALHNEARARFVAVELNFLEGAVSPARVMLASARDAAVAILNKRKLKDIRPDRFAAAEAAAAREASKANKATPARKAYAAKGGKQVEARAAKAADPQAAMQAKRRQLLNNQLVAESIKVREEVRETIAKFGRLNRSNERLAKTGNVDLLQAARWLLTMNGFLTPAAAERTADYMKLVEAYDPALMARLAPVFAKAQELAQQLEPGRGGRRKFTDMVLDDFRQLAEAVETLIYRAKRDLEVKVGTRTEKLREIVDKLVAKLPQTAVLPGEKGALTARDRGLLRLLGTRANLTKVEHYLRGLDDGTHGDFLRYLFDGVRASVDEYRVDAAAFTKKLVDMVAQLRKRGLLPAGKIDAPDLGYTFGNGNRGNGIAELLGALLHMGNPGNREKFLVAGRGPQNPWADIDEETGEVNYSRWEKFLQSKIDDGTLTQEHFDFVQSVWDLMEEIKPMLQASHHELEGYRFREVKAEPFTVTFKDGTTKTYRGGYVPAAPDRDLLPPSQLQLSLEELKADFHAGLPKARDGFTKERVEGYRKRPLAMDITRIGAHIDEAIRYAKVQPRVADVLRILNDPRFATAMNRFDREGIRSVLTPFLERALTQALYEKGKDPTVDAFWKMVRRNTGVAIMFANPVNALQQTTGIINSLHYVDGRHLRGAVGTYMRRRGKLVDEIVSRSDFMDDRLKNQMQGLTQDLRELMLDPTAQAKLNEWVGRKAYFLQSMVQNQVDIVTWWGAYQQATEKGATEADAATAADSAVRLSQGSFNPEDVANYEVGSPFYRSWTQFTGYFNTVLSGIMSSKNHRLKATLLLFTIPMITAQAIAMTLWGKWDDEDDDGHWDTTFDLLLGSQLSGAAAFIPAWGPAASGFIQQAFSDRAFGDKVAASPAMVTLSRSVAGLLGLAAAAASDEKDVSAKKVRDALTAIILLVPGAGILAPGVRPATYAADVATGRVQPTGPVDMVRGLLTGRASEASTR